MSEPNEPLDQQSAAGGGSPDAPLSGEQTPAKEACTLAMLAHLLGLFTSFLGPLIIWLLKKDESEFVDDQAKEALNFQITLMIAYAVSGVLTCVVIGLFLMIALAVADVVFCILATIAANKGERYRYPLTIRLVK